VAARPEVGLHDHRAEDGQGALHAAREIGSPAGGKGAGHAHRPAMPEGREKKFPGLDLRVETGNDFQIWFLSHPVIDNTLGQFPEARDQVGVFGGRCAAFDQ
jgi:hypothetical protein